jgi:hypothetical protein
LFVADELGLRGQLAVHQQISNLLEFGLLGEVQNVVAAVLEVIALAANRAQRGVSGRNTRKRDRLLGLGPSGRNGGRFAAHRCFSLANS